MLRHKSIAALMAISALGTLPAAAHSSPDNPQYISLLNGGGYIIKTVTVKWKDGAVTKQTRFTSNFYKDQGFCVDLKQVRSGSGESIPLGAEVWISAEIDGGDTSSCRKDKKHYYRNSQETWSLIMSGTTLNNNRCENTDKMAPAYMVQSGNSVKCGDAG